MDESQNGGSAAGLSRGRRMLVLGICCLSLLIVGLDTTIVNVALPAIRSSLHASVSGLQWTIDAYTLVLASLLMLAGSTADRIGRKRIFRAATHTGWWICAGLGVLSLVLGLLTTTQWAENTARETAERFRESEEPPSRGAARTRSEQRELAAR